jgi:hypothetical protein
MQPSALHLLYDSAHTFHALGKVTPLLCTPTLLSNLLRCAYQ